jgi:hypothetical protein
LAGRQLDLELGSCSVSAAAYKVGIRFGPGIKTGRQNEASSKFDGSRCFQHDNRSLHLLHSTLSYRLETSTRRQCVACNALKADKRGEEIAKMSESPERAHGERIPVQTRIDLEAHVSSWTLSPILIVGIFASP